MRHRVVVDPDDGVAAADDEHLRLVLQSLDTTRCVFAASPPAAMPFHARPTAAPTAARNRRRSPRGRTSALLQQVLEALDKTLIPSAQNAELKALLVAVRPAFVAHLDHARHIQASLKKG